MALRQEVLSLYRRIYRLSYTWQSAIGNPGSTETERLFIQDEARKLFRKNKGVTNEEEIRQHLKEGETRLELAVHYGNPYPRPVHLPQHVLHSPSGKRLKVQKKKLEQSKPIYIKSLDDDK